MNDFEKCVESLYSVLYNVLKYLKDPDQETKINDLRTHLRDYCLIEKEQKAIEKKLYDPQNLDKDNEIIWLNEQINVDLPDRMKVFDEYIKNFSSHDNCNAQLQNGISNGSIESKIDDDDEDESDEGETDESEHDESVHNESEADQGGVDEGELDEGELDEGEFDEGELDEGQGDQDNMDVDES